MHQHHFLYRIANLGLNHNWNVLSAFLNMPKGIKFEFCPATISSILVKLMNGSSSGKSWCDSCMSSWCLAHIQFQCPVCKADVTQPPHGLDPEPVVFHPNEETHSMLHPMPTANATEQTPLLSTHEDHNVWIFDVRIWPSWLIVDNCISTRHNKFRPRIIFL